MTFKIATKQDIRRAAGHCVICGFDGTSVTPELREVLREVQPAGVILFSRNIESLEQLCELNRELKLERRSDPLLCSVDQEGGRVARVREPASLWPAMGKLGMLDDPSLMRQVGGAIARELRALNFDVDYAPVLDVATNPKNPVIGDRALSHEPAVVARLGRALIEGLQAEGVAACGKHFPGHGDTDKDSHLALPFVEHELGRLRDVEWPPFREAIAAGVGAIMTAHVVVMPLDEKLPATLSASVLGHLRQELGFSGVIVSDDVEMKALADHFPLRTTAERGLNAGIDLFLACHKPEVVLELYRSLVQAVESEEVAHGQLLAAEQRVLAWRDRFYRAPEPWKAQKHRIGPETHGRLLADVDGRLQAGLA
jgi:beta-N-acetylhexosaminidase